MRRFLRRGTLIFLVLFLVLLLSPTLVFADLGSPSSSPVAGSISLRGLAAAPAAVINPENLITFSEYPLDTKITNQYADKGIIFGGDSPFISVDYANPTAPVLSGSPRFQGAIEGTFVDPDDGVTPAVVEGFSLDAGYFDAYGSVRLAWYAPDGTKLGQKIGSIVGIQTFTVQNGSIASWRIETIKEEPAGFAIDNVSIKPMGDALLFREQSNDWGFWGRFFNYIPGFDHNALLSGGLVYESNVLHPPGTYVDETGLESVANNNTAPESDGGVQFYHTKGTFKWDALEGAVSHVSQFAEVPISSDLAQRMETQILSVADAPFYYLPYIDLGVIEIPKVTELVPELQKGGNANGGFTCVGLMEWAAESVGHNNGEGFIKDEFESATLRIVPTFEFAWPPVGVEEIRVGLLSPELLYQSAAGNIAAAAATAEDIKEWIQGFFDPVDVVITDPLGRRLGFSISDGTLEEIPGAFYSGDGLFEQFLIVGAVPGLYIFEFTGLGEEVSFGIASEKHGVGMQSKFLGDGEEQIMYFVKEVVPGGKGDIDGDGDVDADDVVMLQGKIPVFTESLNDSGDLNGDGLLSEDDLELLNQLVNIIGGNQPPVALCQDITVATTSDSCEAQASIDNGSYDPDGDIITLAQDPPGPYELGETPVTLTVTDENGETDSCTATVTVVDETAPTVSISQPAANDALLDGVTLLAEASDNCSLDSVRFSIQEPNGTEVLSLNAYLESGDTWKADFNSTSLQDGYYILVAIATDESGNEGLSAVVPISIRNWAVIEHLPSTPDSKAGRTMPVKFSLRIAESVDPQQPFVRSEELEISITSENGGDVYQSSEYGDSSTDYRINGELYITNFKTSKVPQAYQVQIWRTSNSFLVGSFTFATTK